MVDTQPEPVPYLHLALELDVLYLDIPVDAAASLCLYCTISTKYSPIVTCDHKYSHLKYSGCLFGKNSGAAGAKNCLFGTPKLKNIDPKLL
jgi:hypothetical protein